jgi:hypothetical protein
MQLGKALVGALIGAALGIGLLVVAFVVFHLDRVWLAIPVALLTGLGVRLLVSTSGHPSYLRGAITGAIALVAYLGGWYIAGPMATAKGKAEASAGMRVAAAADAEEGKPGEPADAAAPVETPPPIAARPAASGAGQKAPIRRDFSTMDFIWLCIAGLIAYELGRGTGGAAPAPAPESEPETTGAPSGAHPDA